MYTRTYITVLAVFSFSPDVEAADVTKERHARRAATAKGERGSRAFARVGLGEGSGGGVATITRDLCSPTRPGNLQMPPATFSRSPSHPLPRSAPSRSTPSAGCSRCNAVAVGRKPRRKETWRIAPARSRARTIFCAPKFIRGDASPGENLAVVARRRANCCLSSASRRYHEHREMAGVR